jgi:hypothetical protein
MIELYMLPNGALIPRLTNSSGLNLAMIVVINVALQPIVMAVVEVNQGEARRTIVRQALEVAVIVGTIAAAATMIVEVPLAIMDAAVEAVVDITIVTDVIIATVLVVTTTVDPTEDVAVTVTTMVVTGLEGKEEEELMP